MIITRSPLRITLGGGGTDLPSYYRRSGGHLVAAAIDKYVYITLHETFAPEIIVKYSKLERVTALEEIKHPIIREALRLTAAGPLYLELTSMADIPAGSGLGSSGSFTTALLKALHTFKRNLVHREELAEQACKIELDLLKEPIGKQDQYIAAYGGVTCFTFHPDDRVTPTPLALSGDTLYNLEDNLLLFFTGFSRSASVVLQEQDVRSRAADRDMLRNLDEVKEVGEESREVLKSGNLTRFAELMNQQWDAKLKRSNRVSNPEIAQWRQLGLENGALGAKLVGAGGGGFLMFYASDRVRLRRAMRTVKLQEVRFRFDFEGTKLVTQS
ncbi:galactokinase [Planctomycetota bacterium]